jgi:hypothetical protein
VSSNGPRRVLGASFARKRSIPRLADRVGLHPSLVRQQARQYWIFRRNRFLSPLTYQPLSSVQAFLTFVSTMPSADFCHTIRINYSTLSHVSVTCGRSPDVSSTAFSAQPPDLPPAALMDVGFAVSCPLARCRRPLHPVLVHRLAPLLHASFRPRDDALALRYHFTSIRL